MLPPSGLRFSLRGHDLSLTDYLHRDFNFSSLVTLVTLPTGGPSSEGRNRRGEPRRADSMEGYVSTDARWENLRRGRRGEDDSHLRIITVVSFFSPSYAYVRTYVTADPSFRSSFVRKFPTERSTISVISSAGKKIRATPVRGKTRFQSRPGTCNNRGLLSCPFTWKTTNSLVRGAAREPEHGASRMSQYHRLDFLSRGM